MGEQKLLFDSVDGVLRKQFEDVLLSVKEELDEHRSSINDNTSEIQGSFEAVNQLSLKVDKLSERLDELTLLIKGKKSLKRFSIAPLKSREKEVFRVIYELNEKSAFMTYEQVSRRAGLAKEMVVSAVSSMISKGIPLLKRFVGRTCLIRLDPVFKEEQAKGNIVGLDVPLTYWFEKQL